MASYEQLKQNYICTNSSRKVRANRPRNAMVGAFCSKNKQNGKNVEGKTRLRISFYDDVEKELIFKNMLYNNPDYELKMAFSIYRNRLYLIPDSAKGYNIKQYKSQVKEPSVIRLCVSSDPLLLWVNKNEGFYALSFDNECGFYYISPAEKVV